MEDLGTVEIQWRELNPEEDHRWRILVAATRNPSTVAPDPRRGEPASTVGYPYRASLVIAWFLNLIILGNSTHGRTP